MRVLAPKTSELALDIKDWRVLKEFVSNVRQSVSQIAKKSLLSRQAVEYRFKQFKENKLITGSRTVINIGQLVPAEFQIIQGGHIVFQLCHGACPDQHRGDLFPFQDPCQCHLSKALTALFGMLI